MDKKKAYKELEYEIDILIQHISELEEKYDDLAKKARILAGAVKVAAKIMSVNPPGNMDDYTEEMLAALVGSRDHPEQWEAFLVTEGMELAGIKEL